MSPAVLYIQVSVLQESQKTVVIGEWRMPEVKAGTPMYFDFPRPMATRRISFRLLGDVASFQMIQQSRRIRMLGLAIGFGALFIEPN